MYRDPFQRRTTITLPPLSHATPASSSGASSARPVPLAPPLLDLVELLLHPGGEGDIHHVRKGFLEELRDDPAEFRGEKLPVLHPDVSAVPDRLEDRRGRGRRRQPLLPP